MGDAAQDRALTWLSGRDRGISSEAICRHMLGLPRDTMWGLDDPWDPADLGRCIRLLDLIPEWRPRLREMAGHSPRWAALVGAWDELEALYREELPQGVAPRCYARMRELVDGKVAAARG